MKKSTIIIIILTSFCLFLIFLALNAYRKINTIHNSIDPNCVEIRYYTIPQEIHITKNDEAGTKLTFDINGGAFGILKGRLEKEGWIFNHQLTPAKDTNTDQSHWRGMKIKKRLPQD